MLSICKIAFFKEFPSTTLTSLEAWNSFQILKIERAS